MSSRSGRPRTYLTPEDHLRAKVEVRGEDECWPWRSTLNRDGYGVFGIDGRQYRAHRAAKEIWGEVEVGAVLDHSCHHADGTCVGGASCMHRRCCNPRHLRDVTNTENVMAGLSAAAVNSRKSRCKRGHPFDMERITPAGNPGRGCRQCQNLLQRRHQRKRRSEAGVTYLKTCEHCGVEMRAANLSRHIAARH